MIAEEKEAKENEGKEVKEGEKVKEVKVEDGIDI